MRKDVAMEEIRDIEGRLIGYGDAFRGVVENSYKKQTMSIYLPVGGEVVINRENVMTSIARRSENQFYVYSQHEYGKYHETYSYVTE